MHLLPILPMLASALLLAACSAGEPIDPNLPAFSKTQLDSLRQALAAAPQDALPRFDASPLDRALEDGSENAIRRAALALSEQLAKAHLHGCTAAAERSEWYIKDSDDSAALRSKIDQALLDEAKFESFFAGLNPAPPEYAALRSAYNAETDPARRLTLARNMERWRWLPRELGPNHVLVNVPAFEVYLRRSGEAEQTWRAVVGKKATPTPQLAASITAVTFNPWWDVPVSIVREGGSFSPRRGYIRTKRGHVRQKPGPFNSLGQIKVEMANSHAIYLHDTPSKGLFGAASRAYSHGCVRVGDPLTLAATLLEGVRSRDDIDILVGNKPPKGEEQRISRAPPSPAPSEPPPIKTATVKLPAALPVYVAYFTAAPRADGTLAFPRDIYGRDEVIPDPASAAKSCDSSGITNINPPPPKPTPPKTTIAKADNAGTRRERRR